MRFILLSIFMFTGALPALASPTKYECLGDQVKITLEVSQNNKAIVIQTSREKLQARYDRTEKKNTLIYAVLDYYNPAQNRQSAHIELPKNFQFDRVFMISTVSYEETTGTGPGGLYDPVKFERSSFQCERK